MKLLLAALFVTAVAADKLVNLYEAPPSDKSGSFLQPPFRTAAKIPAASYGTPIAPAQSYSSLTRTPIAILRLNNDNNGDGAYKFDFETENHISQQESGQLRNAGTDQEINAVQGTYSYQGTDGATYSVSYVADENGFRADGSHLPTPPPASPEILKALQQNAADEAAGIIDDGQYRPEPQRAGAIAAASRSYLAPKAHY